MNIGIDLGTTYSVVSYVDKNGIPQIITNSEGSKITPSAIFFDNENIVVGEVAKREKEFSPENVVDVVKRTMGKDITFSNGSKNYRPEELSGFILKKLIQDAEAELNEKVTGVVITVPAYFNDKERQATVDAATLAGANVLQIINEPTAAALAYGYKNEAKNEENVLVYDLGGGTFDITLLSIGQGEMKTVATDGNHRLGGVDFDNVIVDYIIEEIDNQLDYDAEDDDELMAEIELEAERIKKALTSKSSERITLRVDGEKFRTEYTKKQFENDISSLVDKTVHQLRACVLEANYELTDVDKILLVGGSTRIPLIGERLSQNFTVKTSKELNPDEVVAVGAGILAAKLGLEDKLDPNEEVDSKLNDISFTDVNSIGIGMVANNDNGEPENTIIVEKHTQLPAIVSKTFYLLNDNQEYVLLQLTEGDDLDLDFVEVVATANVSLPEGRMQGDPIIVEIGIDKNGCIVVTAIDGVSETVLKSIEIEKTGALTEKEISALIEENEEKKIN